MLFGLLSAVDSLNFVVNLITLINPNLLALKKDPMTTGVVFMPFGLAYLAAYLQAQGFPVSVIDAFGQAPGQVRSQGKFMVFGLEINEIISRIPSSTSAIFIYAINLLNHDATISILQAVRKQFAHVPIAVVENAQAVTAYSLPQAARYFYNQGADYIIVGDPEKRAVQLLKNLKAPDRLRSLQGIGTPDFFNPAVDIIKDLDSLPFPAWNLFPLENYWALRYGHGPISARRYLPLLTSRGCPYSCRFCVSPATNMKRWRARSAKNVVDEIEYYLKHISVREFHIEDLNPTVSEKRIQDICREILARKLDITWKIVSGTKVETIKDEQTIELMAKAGCRYLSISPETGSERVLRLMNKPFNLNHAVRIVNKVKKEGIFCQACFVLGFPGENDQDRQLTKKMVCSLTRKGIDEIALFIITPVPGAEIHDGLPKNISLSELNFTPTWRPDYVILRNFKNKLYRTFLLKKFLHHPLAVIRQVFNFFRKKFDTKMEMVPYRALMYRLRLLQSRFGPGAKARLLHRHTR